MKKYLGVKVIQAEPMTHGEFSLKKYGNDNSTEFGIKNKEAEGYLVQYDNEYISWSPKDVFEKAYREVVDFDFLKQIDVYPSGDWNFVSVDNYQGECCDDSCDNTCESIN